MKVTVCDACKERVEGPLYVLDMFRFVINGQLKHLIEHKEFCSLVCMHEFLENDLRRVGALSPFED